jgi:hypothetical protein
MFRSILRSDYILFLISAYLLFAFTILTNGWFFLVGNNSIGFKSGCILSAILSILSIIRVFGRHLPSNTVSKIAIVCFSLLLLGVIAFWLKVTSG